MDEKIINVKANMRGIRKCYLCGYYNGYRRKGCKNKTCIAFIDNTTKKRCWIESIELISNNNTRLFSVKVKERDCHLRNFVEITDTTLSTEDEHTTIVNRNAVCYVDTCKYDVRDIEIICKHVKSATNCNKRAEQIDIDKNVINGLKITQYHKNVLWNIYVQNSSNIPPLQRLNLYTFVVVCPKNIMFPAGRLHIIIKPDGININKLNSEYSCSCKKFKEALKSNNLSEKYLCFHILFLLTGIMSSSSLKYEFQSFCNLFGHFWGNFNEQQGVLLYNDELETFQQCENESSFSNATKINNVTLPDEIVIHENKLLKTEQLQIYDMKYDQNSKLINNDSTLKNTTLQFNVEIENLNDLLKYDDIIFDNYSSNNNGPDELILKMCDTNESDNVILDNLTFTDLEPSVCNEISNDNFLPFKDWLNFVIEKINQSLINFNGKDSKIIHHFSIHENFFNLLHNRFSLDNRKRLPNISNFIKLENKNFIKHSWFITNKFELEKIFKTKTSLIIFENFYKKDQESDERVNENANKFLSKKYKLIKPKSKIVFIQLETNSKNVAEKSYFIIEWIPNVYSESKFGILRLEFNVDIKIRSN